MNKSIGWFVACSLGLVACNVEHYDHAVPGDCDPFGDGNDFGGTHSGDAGSKASGGHSAGTGGSTSTASGAGSGAGNGNPGAAGSVQNGGDAGGEAGAPATTPVPTPCDKERDCAPGYNCDLDQHQCLPADQETCGELDTELACTNRKDCTPVYGGVNCSCGKDCTCHGGDPGCVCESFEFFVCRTAQ